MEHRRAIIAELRLKLADRTADVRRRREAVELGECPVDAQIAEVAIQ